MPTVLGGLVLGVALLGMGPTPAHAAADPVVAKVNGTAIHQSEVNAFRRDLPPQLRQMPSGALVEALVNYQLVDTAARKEGLQRQPAVRQAMKAASDAVLRQAWLNKHLSAAVTPKLLRQTYDEQRAKFVPQEQVHASHILLATKAEAEKVISELKHGANFADLARKVSTDPSAKQNGGDLGFFSEGDMVPAFAKAAFALKVGEVSPEPVKTQFGWHVIKVEGRRKSTPPTFEEAEPVLRARVAQEMAKKLVEGLRAKAKVKIFDTAGSAK
jgi:peptidyl-prolyl cis-trans isomerase C